MKVLRTIHNYLCYCGIEKDDYNAIKKDAYISNFKIWRILNFLMVAVLGVLFLFSLSNSEILSRNRLFYLLGFVYSVIVTGVFFVIKEDSVLAQLLIYLSISLLFLFGAFVTKNTPDQPSTTFIAFLLIAPIFMIDKPYFMGIELAAASTIYLVWMYYVKDYDIWHMDLINTIIFSVVGFFIHIISNSIRIKEFILAREIKIQKDTDDLTGLKNKGALTREINEFLEDESTDKGIFFILDIDRFKAINDRYGHDVGDSVIRQLGKYLNGYFSKGEIVGRFGGDEFIFFVKDTDDADTALNTAREIVSGVPENITLPDKDHKISASIGIALYHGQEKNYSDIFKKADIALYTVKTNRTDHYMICE